MVIFFFNLLFVYESLYQLIHFCYACLAVSLVTRKHHKKYIAMFYLCILEDLMQIFSHCSVESDVHFSYDSPLVTAASFSLVEPI